MHRLVAVATILSAIASLLPQITGLLLLEPVRFGQFSLIYLAYAFGVSVGLSVVSEAWHSARLAGGEDPGWRPYSTASLVISAGVLLLAALVALIAGLDAPTAILGALAAALAVFRSNARYFYAERSEWIRVVRGEIAFVVGFGAVLGGGMSLGLDVVTTLTASWLAGAASSVLFTLPAVPRRTDVRSWLSVHRAQIPRLLSDSLLMDVGAIFTPLLVAPILGVRDFGTYRAVSNVAAPVRLLLNPLRPVIAARESSRRWNMMLVGGALSLGLGAASVLLAIGVTGLQIGVLTSLAPLAPAVGLTVAANFIGHYFYIRARTRSSARQLLTARVAQTVVVTALPLLGALLGGLTTAVWALATSGALTALVWALTERGHQRASV